MGKDTLTVTDNRTGKTYELEIKDGTIRSLDLRQIKVSEEDFGLMGYDPAFTNTASCRSRVTFIDGAKGILMYRGYPIEQLAEHSSFLETAYLLIFGELPTKKQLDDWGCNINHHTFIHENIRKLLGGFRYDAHPMGMLVSMLGALSTFYPKAKKIRDPETRKKQFYRLIAKTPTLAAFSFRHTRGLPMVYPDDDLSYAGNFLNMLWKMSEVKYEPNPVLEKSAGCAVHLARGPRAELQRQCDAQRGKLAGRSLLRGCGGRGGALRAAARWRQRAGAADAARNRVDKECPRLRQAGQGG